MASISAPGAPWSGEAGQNFSLTSQNLSMGSPSSGRGGRQLPGDGRFVLQSNTLAAAPDSSGRWRGYATQYYPASRSITSAEPITLASGDERNAVDIQMRYVPVSNISGTVIAPNGSTVNLVLRLIAAIRPSSRRNRRPPRP